MNHQLMLDRRGKPLHVGDMVVVLNTFPATVKGFRLLDDELCVVVQRSAGPESLCYFEEIERSNPTKTIVCRTIGFCQQKASHEEETYWPRRPS